MTSQVHDLLGFTLGEFNVSHVINHVSFGSRFPGMNAPLDKRNHTVLKGARVFQYYLKVIPTEYVGGGGGAAPCFGPRPPVRLHPPAAPRPPRRYVHLNGRTTKTNQFAVTQHVRELNPHSTRGLPGVFFNYEISPLVMVYEEKRASLAHFLTSVCAIVGGVFTVFGLVDKAVYGALHRKGRTPHLGDLT